jgi:hypothetical protein
VAHRAFQDWAAARQAAETALSRHPDAKTQADAQALVAECRSMAAPGN